MNYKDMCVGEWNYSYDLAGNLVSQAGGGGNLISGDGYFREYNSLNQLVKIRNGSGADSPLLEQYYYDPYGQRIKIWRNDSAGTTVYTPFRELMQVRNGSGVYNFTYIYDGSTLVARVEPDNTVHYYHPDHLGSTTLITGSSGTAIETTFYEPFGTVISGGSSDVKLYTGQYNDELTNQYYYGARYYKPYWGKFVQVDPIVLALYNPQALNRYAYALNNPYLFSDPNGREPVRSQAGNVHSVVNYIRSVEQSSSNPYTTLAIVSKTYFSYESSSISDKSSSSFAANFVYTSERGVIDNRHFFANALANQIISDAALYATDYIIEGLQLIIPSQRQSFLTYEDIRSNRVGRLFGNQLDPNRPLSEQYEEFMGSLGGGEFPDWLWETMPEEETIGQIVPSWKRDITGVGKALPSSSGRSGGSVKSKGNKREASSNDWGCIGDICVRSVR